LLPALKLAAVPLLPALFFADGLRRPPRAVFLVDAFVLLELKATDLRDVDFLLRFFAGIISPVSRVRPRE
jgi:hypothetical protein